MGREIKRNKKPIIALMALAILVIGGTFAYFTSTVIFPNIFGLAIYKTSTTEVFDSPNNWAPGETIPKTITTTNEGNVDVAVRINIEEQWHDHEGADITDDMTDAAIINFSNPGDWSYDDGYYYYNQPLAPGHTTSSFIESVTLNPDINDVTCSGTGLKKTCSNTQNHYKLTITVETAQNDKYKEIWNTDHDYPTNPVYALGDIVYYDPVSNNTCDTSTFNLTNVNNGSSTCYKWRVIDLADSAAKNDVKLQLDHHITVSAYSNDGISGGPKSVFGVLSGMTRGWTKLPNLNYTYDSSSYDYNYGTLTCVDGVCSANNAVIAGGSENPIKARIITAEELDAIFAQEEEKTGCNIRNSGNVTQRYFSYESLQCQHNDGGDKTLSWLIENTQVQSPDFYGSTNSEYNISYPGYWTLSPHSYSDNYTTQIYYGYVTSAASSGSYSGVRPVIVADKNDTVLGNAIPYNNVARTDSDTHQVYHPGDIVYFDPVSDSTCDSANVGNTCYKWRVIETNDSSDKVDITLQLDHNIVNTVSLSNNQQFSYLYDIVTKIKTDTTGWTRVPLMNYSYDATVNGNLLGRSYGYYNCLNGDCGVIKNNKYSQITTGMRVRTITPEEVDALNAYYGQTAVYNKLYNNNPGSYATISIHNDAQWLLENTNNNSYGSYNYGYWTISILNNRDYYSEFWLMDSGNNQLRSSDGASNRGLRPVVTIPKSLVSNN